jgi:hypothetical protein
MSGNTENQQSIPESFADELTRQKLAKARRRTRAFLARKLKVSPETIRRYERRADLYLSTLRQYLRRRGGDLRLEVEFPNQAPVILAGLRGDEDGKRAKKRAGKAPNAKAQTKRAA